MGAGVGNAGMFEMPAAASMAMRSAHALAAAVATGVGAIVGAIVGAGVGGGVGSGGMTRPYVVMRTASASYDMCGFIMS